MEKSRSRALDWTTLVVQLAAVLVIIRFISPQGRAIISGFGAVAVCIVIVILPVFLAFLIYRLATKSQRVQNVEPNVDWKASGVIVKPETR